MPRPAIASQVDHNRKLSINSIVVTPAGIRVADESENNDELVVGWAICAPQCLQVMINQFQAD